MIEQIKKYWKTGISTLPVKEDKSPFNISSWNGGIDDPENYKKAFGVAVICGKPSGGVECLDFDNHFGDAKTNISQFISDIQDVYDRHKFPIQSTAGGGFHLVFRCKKNEGNQKLASRPMWDEKSKRFRPDAVIETRGSGGYFVVSPTPGYDVVRNDMMSIPEVTEEERSHLMQVAKTYNKWYDTKPLDQEQQDRPGDLYNNNPESISEMKAELIKAGWEEVRAHVWKRPGKKEGISATLGRVADNVFYVFSSNAYPFEPNRAYTPFSLVGLLRYNGNYGDFAKELSDKYRVQKPLKKEYGKVNEEERDVKKLDDLLYRAAINLDVPVPKPPVCLKIKDFEDGIIKIKRLFTLGNFSAITGKSKSKKSFLASMFLASAIKRGDIDNKFVCELPPGKENIVLIDTEQSVYDAYICSKRAVKLSGLNSPENFMSFDFREFTPTQRCEIIEYMLEKMKSTIGYLVIDGIADLAKAINDEDEASRVVSLLMKWTTIYNCHITVVIHQNKNDSYATGHLGSAILKKAEAILSVTKSQDHSFVSDIACDNIRGSADFNPFSLQINPDGMPEITDLKDVSDSVSEKDLPF